MTEPTDSKEPSAEVPGSRGRTRFLRFGAISGVGVVLAAGVGALMATGAIAANFTLSGANFQLVVPDLTGSGFKVFGNSLATNRGEQSVVTMKVDHIQLSGMCISAQTRAPAVGDITIIIRVPKDKTAQADNLIINSTSVDGTITLKNALVGADASQFNSSVPQGSFGLVGDTATGGVTVNATAISASSLSLTGVQISVHRGKKTC